MKKVFFLIIGFFTLNIIKGFTLPVYTDENEYTLSKADVFTLSGYTEVSKRSTSEDYEEEDTDDDYTYHNYHLKFGQKVSDRLIYNISSFIYDKNYDTKDSLDNVSKIFKTNWSYFISKLEEESLELGLKMKYKEKRYDNSPKSEYNQVTGVPDITFTKKDFYTINLSAGIDDFDYLKSENNDQLKIFSKLGGKRYFLGKKLMLTSSYKIEQLKEKKIDRKRTKQDAMGGFDYIFDFPWLYEITTRASWGQRDTKEEDERDDDYDYEYRQYYAGTEHRINKRLNANLKYQYFKRDYIDADLNHEGFYIQNGWGYEILDNDKNRIWLDFDIEHKNVNYSLKLGNNYRKETAGIKANYKIKQNGWKVSAGLIGNNYDFNDSNNDKKRYYTNLSIDKYFIDGDLTLGIDFISRYTDYVQKDSVGRNSVRAVFKYSF